MRTAWRPRLRPAHAATLAAVIATLAVSTAVTLVANTTIAEAAVGVEDEGADCVVPALPDVGSLPTNSRLPDPFRKLDGTRIAAKSDWRCRRQEIKRLAERFVYGEKPARPQGVTGTVSRTGVTVNVTHNGRSSSFSASVSLPTGTGPFPAVVVVGGFGADTATIRAAGAAVINFDPFTVGREGTPRNNKQGAFYSIYGATSGTGLLMAWAWGVSRIIDVIAQSDGSILRADAMGVTGCSRFGKGAFVIGVFDQRIALTMPIESGSAGVPIFRGIPGEGAQSLSSAYTEQPWLGDAFGSFTGSPGRLPVDNHSMVAMVAPRGLFIMDNPHIANLGPRSASVAALGGAEVYRALGAGDNITYWSDVQDGTHCANRTEWRIPLQQTIRKFLLRTGNDPGAIRMSSRAAGNLAEWRDWQTPTLTDSGPSSPVSSPPVSSPPVSSPPVSSPSQSSSPPVTPGTCTVQFNQNPPWSTGFTANMRITNNGTAAINGWALRFTLPVGQNITGGWNATYTPTSGQVTGTNVGWNATIPAGGSVGDFGFQATHTGNTAEPTSFTLNGTPCTTA